ncbi:MAG TPA: hypothetical protein VGE04_05370, partial [Chloroflexia bacterium]
DDNYGAQGATGTAEQGDGDIERVDYDLQTGGLISSGRAGWAANTGELSDAKMGGEAGEAGEAGAPEFGSGDGTESQGGYGGSDSDGEPDLTRGQQTIPFSNDNPGDNLDVDNEPPHPGDTSTTDRSQTY